MALVVNTGESGEVDVESTLKIDPNNLSQEAAHQASQYAYWAALAKSSAERAERCKTELEVLEAQLGEKKREVCSASGEKVTEAKILQMIKLDPLYKAKKDELAGCRKDAGIMSSIETAFASRQHMITGMIKLHLAELGGDVSVKAQTSGGTWNGQKEFKGSGGDQEEA